MGEWTDHSGQWRVFLIESLILFAPLGDRLNRRRLIVWQIMGICVALLVAATAPTLVVLIAASLAIGAFATMAQQAGPFAAELAPSSRRGRAIGVVMRGLLLGILLARTASGFSAGYFGWRAVFAATIVAMLILAVEVFRHLPRSQPTSTLTYRKLLASLWHLMVELRGLREAALTGASLFAAFSLFWSVLALQLAGAHSTLVHGTRDWLVSSVRQVPLRRREAGNSRTGEDLV